MVRRYIFANTLNWHFIYFAKIMGIYPKIRSLYLDVTNLIKKMQAYREDNIEFFSNDSYNRYIDLYLKCDVKYLNEAFVKSVYFFGTYGYEKFTEKEIVELTNLFFSYLKDKKIYDGIRIERS